MSTRDRGGRKEAVGRVSAADREATGTGSRRYQVLRTLDAGAYPGLTQAGPRRSVRRCRSRWRRRALAYLSSEEAHTPF